LKSAVVSGFGVSTIVAITLLLGNFPQGLKPLLLSILFGTTEVVALQNSFVPYIIEFVPLHDAGAKAHFFPDLLGTSKLVP
jgi:hypothetical protein